MFGVFDASPQYWRCGQARITMTFDAATGHQLFLVETWKGTEWSWYWKDYTGNCQIERSGCLIIIKWMSHLEEYSWTVIVNSKTRCVEAHYKDTWPGKEGVLICDFWGIVTSGSAV